MNLFFGLFLSCSSLDDEKNTSSVVEDNEELLPTELCFIPERPFDMTIDSDGTLLISADASGKLYRWDGFELTEVAGFYNDIQAVLVHNETLYYTTTEDGVTGSLEMDGQGPLITQADDGTLLRWPVDLISLDDGTVLIADYMARRIFSYEVDGVARTFEAGTQTPQALVSIDDSIYIGGEDGIWYKENLDAEPNQIDDRSANGLIVHNGLVYASNSQDGIFVVEGIAYSLPNDIGRPSTLLVNENMLYVIDQVSRSIWTADVPNPE